MSIQINRRLPAGFESDYGQCGGCGKVNLAPSPVMVGVPDFDDKADKQFFKLYIFGDTRLFKEVTKKTLKLTFAKFGRAPANRFDGHYHTNSKSNKRGK